VLEKGAIRMFPDETQQQLTGEFKLSKRSTVEMLAPGSDPSRKWQLAVFDVDGSSSSSSSRQQPQSSARVVLIAEDANAMEMWMLAIIQEIQGPYRASENFCGEFAPTIFTKLNAIDIVGDVNEPSAKKGYLDKCGSGYKSWKKRLKMIYKL